MTAALADQARLDLPGHWPAALAPRILATIDAPTPLLAVDLTTVTDRYTAFTAALPGVSTFFAMKCNADEDVIGTLAALGSSFEVASVGELRILQDLGIDPAEVLYSNPIKPPAAIAEARRAGLWRFSFDSEGELHKLAQHAPGAAVYIRLRVDDSTSLFPLSRKFGAEAHEARALMHLAHELGLHPYGITFHVGSQCATTSAWRQAIAAAGRLMTALQSDGIHLEMLDIGGGFPARYVERVPSLDQIAAAITPALAELLPYRPALLAAEPGRHLVAESAVLITSVLGREVRAGENWLYVDVGAYNGMMETQQTVQQWRFPLWTSRPDHALVPHLPFTVTGPSCDSSDTMFYGVNLPSTIDVGDHLYIGSAGAYTLSYASHFNGFAPPEPVILGAPPRIAASITSNPPIPVNTPSRDQTARDGIAGAPPSHNPASRNSAPREPALREPAPRESAPLAASREPASRESAPRELASRESAPLRPGSREPVSRESAPRGLAARESAPLRPGSREPVSREPAPRGSVSREPAPHIAPDRAQART
ncbi:type III PLP-dependent enzyme [Dactylosporangium sp. CA-092794]|uniref:type III PLP-dependent enzyme n=1 Tax=Dactylosporangium sp. CA-092794 TaxID=3239929 RepID=UPI003D8CBBDD